MLLFTLRLTDDVIRRKAPPNMMYQVDAVSFSNKTAIAAAFGYVVDRWFPSNIGDTVGTDVNNILAAMDLTGTGNFMVNNIDHKTKFISVAKTDAATSNLSVSIYGKIIPASRIQLIIEWFRKGGV